MKLGPPCKHCGARELSGVFLTSTQARLFDAVRRATEDGVDLHEVTGIPRDRVKAHVWYLNQKLEILDLRVEGQRSGRGYRLVKRSEVLRTT
jgi:hypothetical protein